MIIESKIIFWHREKIRVSIIERVIGFIERARVDEEFKNFGLNERYGSDYEGVGVVSISIAVL